MFIIKQTEYGGVDMYCSAEDSIEFSISGFDEEAEAEFIISKGENVEPIIKNTYKLLGESVLISLSNSERKKLPKGDYIYKLSIKTADGKTYTQLSGDFIVKWGVEYE